MIPPYLHKGDKIAIIATARKVVAEELTDAISILTQWGLDVVLGKNLFVSDHQLAGTDAQRAEDLQWAINDPAIKAVFIARGGYGTMRLMERVDFSKFMQHPKWIVGYSDVTILHSHCHNLQIPSIHATMPFTFSKHQEATDSIRGLLFGESYSYTTDSHSLNREGKATAPIVGGNLSLLYALSGTPYDLDTTDTILFIEDLDEYLYHIDRMMMQLKLSGKLAKLKGLVIGGMNDMKDNAIPFGKTVEEIILDAVKEYNYPVCFNFPAGHIDRNLAICLGKTVELKVTSHQSTLNYV